MKRLLIFALLVAVGSCTSAAQEFVRVSDGQQSANVLPDFSVAHRLPVLEPGIALQLFLQRSSEQDSKLSGYKDETTVTAELPDTKQKGEYQLERTYTAQPKTLQFSNAKFTGDGFVKTNVITRLLQSEVDHVEKGNPAETAISSENYKFYYKGMEGMDGHDFHVFQVKPRKKTPGLFKGRLYLDVHTGSLRRMEGSVVKSPSFFIKNLEFVQEFDDVDGFTFPTQLHSSAKARIIGRALVTVLHRGYKVMKADSRTEAMLGAK